ncbi:DUF3179 domain-containing protein [Minwuia sp.]|uniref:DUF3179 domain-containing protein n=1 Tax=Minwuia sp. TaxID=2493630 RepID=UPI003A909382
MIRRFIMPLLFTALLAGAATAEPVSREEMHERIMAIFQSHSGNRTEALNWFVERGNIDIAPTLIVAHRFVFDADDELDAALTALTGHEASGWFDWMLWQEANPQVRPHDDYVRLRRILFDSIDPRFDVFFDGEKAEAKNMRIRLEEIVWGGVPALDGIPSLDNPKLIAARDADYLKDQDLVFGVSINGDARAYPLRIMGWHEMFNDVVGGQPVALAYCTLCGSGILYDTAVEGREAPFVFGSSGLLYRSNKLMYDQQTRSLWNQFTGEPVTGELAFSGIRLKTLPVAVTSWVDWRAANPQTRVLSLDTGFRRDYGAGVVYRDYFSSPDLMFPARVRNDSPLHQKGRVFGIRQAGVARAWPLAAFEDGEAINDAIGETSIVLIGDTRTRTVRAYERDGLVFHREGSRLQAGDTEWQMTEEALVGPGGRKLRRVAGHVAYWFAWDGYLGDAATLYPQPSQN